MPRIRCDKRKLPGPLKPGSYVASCQGLKIFTSQDHKRPPYTILQFKFLASRPKRFIWVGFNVPMITRFDVGRFRLLMSVLGIKLRGMDSERFDFDADNLERRCLGRKARLTVDVYKNGLYVTNIVTAIEKPRTRLRSKPRTEQ